MKFIDINDFSIEIEIDLNNTVSNIINIIKYNFKNIKIPKLYFDRQILKPWVKTRKDRAMQIPLEIENLQLAVNKHNSKVVVEIGTANGGTISRWFEFSKRVKRSL